MKYLILRYCPNDGWHDIIGGTDYDGMKKEFDLLKGEGSFLLVQILEEELAVDLLTHR